MPAKKKAASEANNTENILTNEDAAIIADSTVPDTSAEVKKPKRASKKAASKKASASEKTPTTKKRGRKPSKPAAPATDASPAEEAEPATPAEAVEAATAVEAAAPIAPAEAAIAEEVTKDTLSTEEAVPADAKPTGRKPYPTKEERVAKVEMQIAKIENLISGYQDKLDALRRKREHILSSGTRKVTPHKIIAEAIKNGMSTEDIAKALGIAIKE